MKIPILCLLVASYYSPQYSGRPTASGQPYDPSAMTCAHRDLPFGTKLLIYTPDKHVIVTVNDRGPFVAGRKLDLSSYAFKQLADPDQGLVHVNYIELK
jgi:rare lipoprotein A